MNKEIKFRVWMPKLNRFCGGRSYTLNDIFVDTNSDKNKRYVTDYHPTDPDFAYVDDPSNIQQFTGLKDKNGKEIYEGDIIKGEEFDDDLSKTPRIIIEQVVYDEWFGYDFTKFCRDTIEVIGNIFETPKQNV